MWVLSRVGLVVGRFLERPVKWYTAVGRSACKSPGQSFSPSPDLVLSIYPLLFLPYSIYPSTPPSLPPGGSRIDVGIRTVGDTSASHLLIISDGPIDPSRRGPPGLFTAVNALGKWRRAGAILFSFDAHSEVELGNHPLFCQGCQTLTNDFDATRYFIVISLLEPRFAPQGCGV